MKYLTLLLLLAAINAHAQKKDTVYFGGTPKYDLTSPPNWMHTLEYIPVEYLDENGFYKRPVHLILRDDTLRILIPGAESIFKGARVITMDGLYFKKENKSK